ncbi:MAG: PAS domain S-box protein [Anaerolineae bacterium]|nr:PAS domain S-box protein [Anaerolineae bacterium]
MGGNKSKTKQQLMAEVAQLQQRVDQLETQLKPPVVSGQQNVVSIDGAKIGPSQVRIASIVDIANEAIISVNQAQKIIMYNKGAENIFGYSPEEALGRPLDILIPEKSVAIHRRHITEFAGSETTVRLMGERQEIAGRRKNGQVFPAEASISKLKVDGGNIFTVVLRDITRRKQAEKERERLIDELRALNEAAQAINSELSLEQVLHKIAEAAQNLVKTKFAALGVRDSQDQLSHFITAGIIQQEPAQIGPSPIDRGLLNTLLNEGQSVIINNIAQHPDAAGFPNHYPVMRSLLGVPVFSSKGDLIGALYLADKKDGSDFIEADQKLIEMLAYHAAIAIENARLYEQTQRLAILEEQERFARDLHDGIIQSIYGVGLSLDSAKAAISATNGAARQQIDLSLKSLAQVITDVRNYIFDLRPQALKDKGLYARMHGLIKELQINTTFAIKSQIDPEINTYLSESEASHVFHIAHEALANVVRHSKGRKIRLNLTRDNGQINLLVEDDGIGFTPPTKIKHGHHGLANMQKRVSLLSAKLKIDSTPGQGTRVTLKLPSRK